MGQCNRNILQRGRKPWAIVHKHWLQHLSGKTLSAAFERRGILPRSKYGTGQRAALCLFYSHTVRPFAGISSRSSAYSKAAVIKLECSDQHVDLGNSVIYLSSIKHYRLTMELYYDLL